MILILIVLVVILFSIWGLAFGAARRRNPLKPMKEDALRRTLTYIGVASLSVPIVGTLLVPLMSRQPRRISL